MLRAHGRHLYAFVVLLGLLLAFAAPAIGQGWSDPLAATPWYERDPTPMADYVAGVRRNLPGVGTRMAIQFPFLLPLLLLLSFATMAAAPLVRRWFGLADAPRPWKTRALIAVAQYLGLTALLAALNWPLDTPRPAFPPDPTYKPALLIGALITAAVLLAAVKGIIWFLRLRFRQAPPKTPPPLSDNYGTASYAEMRPLMPGFGCVRGSRIARTRQARRKCER